LNKIVCARVYGDMLVVSVPSVFELYCLGQYLGCSKDIRQYRSFATRGTQLKIWNFLVIGTERNVCRCTCNRYNVI